MVPPLPHWHSPLRPGPPWCFPCSCSHIPVLFAQRSALGAPPRVCARSPSGARPRAPPPRRSGRRAGCRWTPSPRTKPTRPMRGRWGCDGCLLLGLRGGREEPTHSWEHAAPRSRSATTPLRKLIGVGCCPFAAKSLHRPTRPARRLLRSAAPRAGTARWRRTQRVPCQRLQKEGSEPPLLPPAARLAVCLEQADARANAPATRKAR